MDEQKKQFFIQNNNEYNQIDHKTLNIKTQQNQPLDKMTKSVNIWKFPSVL